MNFFPINRTHPMQKPYSGGMRFFDGKPPAPLEFFDETQDHLAALFHAQVGWQWSIHREDFDNYTYPANYLGVFAVDNQPLGAGLTLVPFSPPIASPPSFQGEHGVWYLQSGIGQFDTTLTTARANIGTQDFLISAKVCLINRAQLDPVATYGLWVGCGERLGPDAVYYPSLCCGADTTNWQAWCPPADGQPGQLFDTGIAVQDSTTLSDATGTRAWTVLQICRVGGVVRFFINGALARLTGGDLASAEGIYYPAVLSQFHRRLHTRRWFVGLANTGIYIDYMHRFCRRS